jgi:hypothetical protein
MISEVTQIMQATRDPRTQSKRAPMRTVAASIIALAACTASGDEVRPDDDKFFFPTGSAISPDDGYLFVANANSDLTFDSGAISVLGLQPVDRVIDEWIGDSMRPPVVPAGCSPDTNFTETLVCEAPLFLSETREAGVRIGNFATEVSVQDLGGGALRLIVPTRGDPSIAWADWDGSRLSCNSNGATFELCDDPHRLSFVLNDADLAAIPDEPFGVFADTGGEFAIVTHLTSRDTGEVTLIDSPKQGPARVTDIERGVFAADTQTGYRSATGVVGRTPTAAGDVIYVGSRTEDRIQMFTVGRPVNGAPAFLLSGNWFFTGATDTRGMAFSADGNQLYLVSRRPPVLQIWDTSMDETGFPANTLTGEVDICRQASTVATAQTARGPRVYVTCFQDGQVYVVDPTSSGRTEDIITVGRGPYSVVAGHSDPDVDDATHRRRLYITNFLEHTVAVVDIDPASKFYNRVVLRIGVPKVP